VVPQLLKIFMANIYTWTVDSMVNYPTYEGYTDVVCVVNWVCEGTNGTQTGRSAGASGILFIVSDDPFIPYADLTNDIVIGWVHNALGTTGVDNVQNDIDGQIYVAANPQVTQPPPWG